MQSVSVLKFQKRKEFVIYPTSMMVEGGSIPTSPYIFISEEIPLINLVSKLLETLDFSKTGIKYISDRKKIKDDFLKSVKVKSMKSLHDDTVHLSVILKNGMLSFHPTKNLGSRKGFHFTKDLKPNEIRLESSKEDIVDAFKESLSRCS